MADKRCACGHQPAEQAKFCSRCGRPTVAPEAVRALPKRQPPETTSEPREETPRSPRRPASVPSRDTTARWIIFLVLALLVVYSFHRPLTWLSVVSGTLCVVSLVGCIAVRRRPAATPEKTAVAARRLGAIAAISFLLLLASGPWWQQSQQPQSQIAAESVGPKFWSQRSAQMRQVDADIARNRANLWQLVQDPSWAKYRASVLEFIDLADQLHPPAHKRWQAAILRRDKQQEMAYGLADNFVGVSLYQVSEVLKSDPSPLIRKDTIDWVRQLSGEHYQTCDRILDEYSQDGNAVQLYGEDPGELRTLLVTSARFSEDAAGLLDQGDDLGAWLAILKADFLLHSVGHRLVPYEDASNVSARLGIGAAGCW